MKKLVVAVASALFLFGGQAALADSKELVDKRTELLKQARSVVPQITVQDLNKLITDGEKFTLLDVRDPNELGAGIVDYEKRVDISRGKVEFAAPNQLKKDERIIVMCLTGARSAFSAEALHKLGYTNVTNVSGGITEWANAGLPVKNALGIFTAK